MNTVIKHEITTTLVKLDNEFMERIEETYLDRETWDNQWTIYEDYNFKFELSLDSINTANESIELLVKGFEKGKNYNRRLYTWYNEKSKIRLNRDDRYKDALRETKGIIYRLILEAEEDAIMELPSYQKLEEAIEEGRKEWRKKGEELLDEEGITNSYIRKIFLSKYEDEFKPEYDLKDFVDDNYYRFFNDTRTNIAYLFEDKDMIKKMSKHMLVTVEELEATAQSYIDGVEIVGIDGKEIMQQILAEDEEEQRKREANE